MRSTRRFRIYPPILCPPLAGFALCALLACGAAAEKAPEKEWVVAQTKATAAYLLADYTPSPDIVFSYRDKRFKLDAPSLRKGDNIWVPVEPLVKKMGMVYLRTGDDRFGIIRGDGMPLELKVDDENVTLNKGPFLTIKPPPALYEGTFMLSLDSFSKVLDIKFDYNPAANEVEIKELLIGELEVFEIPKPKELIEKEREEALLRPTPPLPEEPPDIVEEALPAKYMRDINLDFDTSFGYFENKRIDDRTRQLDFGISGRVKQYSVGGKFRMKDFRGTNKERFKENGEFLSVAGKDMSFKFFDNFFSIPTLRSQSQSYFGTEIGYFPKPFRTTFVYGRTDNNVSGTGTAGSVRYYGDLAALRAGYTTPSSRAFTTDETLIVWQNNAEWDVNAGSTDFPRKNIVFATENVYSPIKDLRLSGSYAISNFQPDNLVNAAFIDDNWKVGAEFIQNRFSYSASYERVGAQYVSVSIPDTYQDYEGLEFSTGFTFCDNWSASLGGQLSRNNVERNPRVSTSYNRNLNASTGIRLPWEQNISFGWTMTENYLRGGDNVNETGNRYRDYRVDYVKGWGNLSAQLSYDHYKLEPLFTSTGGSITDTASLSLFNSYPEINNSYARFLHTYRKVKMIADNSYTMEYHDTSLSGRLNVTNYLSTYADWTVSCVLREAYADTAMMTLTVGGEFRSSPVTIFGFDFNLSNYDLYRPKTWIPKYYTMMFRGRHVFGVSTPDKWGVVRMRVFKDLNGNGKHDAGEGGIKEIRVYIANGRAARTDEMGCAAINKVVPGERQAKLDLSSLPPDYISRGPSIKVVTVESLKTVNVEFPVVRAGSIQGRVYIDKNENGVYDKSIDEGLPNVRIYLDPEGKDTLSLSDGSYYLDCVYPGEYDVCIDLESLPSGMQPKTGERTHLVLRENEKLENVDLVIATRKIDIQFVGGE